MCEFIPVLLLCVLMLTLVWLCQRDARTGLILPAFWQWRAKWLCQSWENQLGNTIGCMKIFELIWKPYKHEGICLCKYLPAMVLGQEEKAGRLRTQLRKLKTHRFRKCPFSLVALFWFIPLCFSTSCKKLWPFCTFIWWILFLMTFNLFATFFFLLSYNFSPAFFSVRIYFFSYFWRFVPYSFYQSLFIILFAHSWNLSKFINILM